MKVLYDCFSCSPYYGSDEGIGWLWPFYMREYHDVWAVVRKDRKADIEKYCEEHDIDDIHFIYADLPDWMNFYYRNLAKGKNGTLDFLLYQCLWQFFSYKEVKRIHKKENFDLVHKVGTNDFRILGFMYKLGIPYIIGPIGGAQNTPEVLEYYVRDHKKSEKLRTVLNYCMTHNPWYKKALNKATKVYCSNRETKEYVSHLIKDNSKLEIMTEVGWNGDIPINVKEHDSLKVFTMMWAGRMEYRKGLELLFDILDQLPEDLEWKLLLCGMGSEYQKYKNIVETKKYYNKVEFLGKVSYEEMSNIYNQADVFVFPSLRETTGTVIIEAMAHGVPVIALEQGGAMEVISEDCGYLVPTENRNEIILQFSKVIENCIDNRELLEKLSDNSKERIESKYSWSNKAKNMNDIYIK
ncbi:MAG: glycosyltransferase family 4 protein [Bacillota bacterium]|nr:glycosyltransferase family 4 protein [Bacillota bacterium]